MYQKLFQGLGMHEQTNKQKKITSLHSQRLFLGEKAAKGKNKHILRPRPLMLLLS